MTDTDNAKPPFGKMTKAQLLETARELLGDNRRLERERNAARQQCAKQAEQHPEAVSALKGEIVGLQAKLNRALGYIDKVTERREPIITQREEVVESARVGPRLGADAPTMEFNSYGHRTCDEKTKWWDR